MADTRSDLVDALAEHIGVAPPTAAEIESVLALAAVAAHGTGDRTTAPLASYLAGLAAAKAEVGVKRSANSFSRMWKNTPISRFSRLTTSESRGKQ